MINYRLLPLSEWETLAPQIFALLSGNMLALHPELGGSVSDMSKALHLTEDEVRRAFDYWERRELISRVSDLPAYQFLAPRQQTGGKSALDMAKEGFACHQSQLKYYSVEKDSVKYDCRKFGLAYTTVGEDTEGTNDLFEHVDWSDKVQIQEPSPSDPNPDTQPVSPGDVGTVSPSDTKRGFDWGRFLPSDAKSVLLAGVAALMVLATAGVCAMCAGRKR